MVVSIREDVYPGPIALEVDCPVPFLAVCLAGASTRDPIIFNPSPKVGCPLYHHNVVGKGCKKSKDKSGLSLLLNSVKKVNSHRNP